MNPSLDFPGMVMDRDQNDYVDIDDGQRSERSAVSEHTLTVYNKEYEIPEFQSRLELLIKRSRDDSKMSHSFIAEPTQAKIHEKNTSLLVDYTEIQMHDEYEPKPEDDLLSSSGRKRYLSQSFIQPGSLDERDMTRSARRRLQSIIPTKQKQSERASSINLDHTFITTNTGVSKLKLSVEALCNIQLEKMSKKLVNDIRIHGSTKAKPQWYTFVEQLKDLYDVTKLLRDIRCTHFKAKAKHNFKSNLEVINNDWTSINHLYELQNGLDQLKIRLEQHKMYSGMTDQLKEIAIKKLDQIWKNRTKK